MNTVTHIITAINALEDELERDFRLLVHLIHNRMLSWWDLALNRRAPIYASGSHLHGTPILYGAATNYGANFGVSAGEFYDLFRFAPTEIPRLCAALRMPEYILPNVSGEEGLLIYLRRLSRGDNLLDLKCVFHRSIGSLSDIIKAVAEHLGPIAVAKLQTFDSELWCPWFPVFASAIYLKCEALNCCFGFLDGTFLRICRPSRDGYRGFWQRLFYSGYKHQHGLLFQGLSLPNGILALMHGPYPGGVYNDLSMLEISGILDMLWSFTEINGVRYFLYGDRGYCIEPGLIPPFPRASSMSAREKIFNSRMSSVRVSVEWTFGKIKSLFPFLDVAHKLRIGSMPLGSHYLIATLLTNCHSCLYGSESAQYFNCPAPELEYYMRQ